VDEQRVDPGRVARRPERLDLVGRVRARLPRPRVLVEDLDGVAAALDSALDGLGDATGGTDMGSDQHAHRLARTHAGPLRALPDGGTAHRGRAHGALQLAHGPARGSGRDDAAADRGHRPRAVDPRERRADPRRAALARPGLGRGPGVPDRPRGAPPPGPRPARRRRQGVPDRRRPATTSRRSRPSTAPPRVRGTPEAEGANPACATPTRARPSVRDLSAALKRSPHVHLDDPVIPRATARRSTTSPSRSTTSTPRSPTSSAREPPCRYTPKSSSPCSRRSAPPAAVLRYIPLIHGPDGKKLSKRTAPPRCRSCARRATCPRPCATTSRCSGGAPTTTRRSCRPTSSSAASRSPGCRRTPRGSTSRSCAG
jgi:hypothetical protein